MTRTKKKAFFILSILVLLALILAVGFRLFRGTDFPRSVKLQDGTTLMIAGITYGRQHMSPPGRIPQRVVDKLPTWLATLLGISPRSTMSTPDPVLGVWYEVQPPIPPGKTIPYDIKFADDLDRVSSVSSGILYGPPPGGTLWGTAFAAFPRRSRTLRLCVYDRGQRGVPVRVAEFQCPNPAYREYPKWEAGAESARSASGDLEASVVKLLVGPDAALGRPMFVDEADWLTGMATFRVRFKGKTTTDWCIGRFEIADASGNVMSDCSGYGNLHAGDSETSYRFSPALWVDGSAWKIKAEFLQMARAEFAADELITVKGVPLPAGGEVVYGNWKTNLQGHTITLTGLSGANGVLTNNLRIRFSPSVGQIVGRLQPDSRDTFVSIVKIESSRGDKISVPPYGQNASEFQFGLTLPTNTPAATADITFAVHKSHFLEFMVKPELVTTNHSQSRGGARKN